MASVAGKVYDKRTKQPIPFIGVVLGNKGKSTDMQGHFIFKDPPLPLVLNIKAPFYQPIEKRITAPNNKIVIELMPSHAV